MPPFFTHARLALNTASFIFYTTPALSPPTHSYPPPCRATPAWMRDLHVNYTNTVRDWLEIDTELSRLGLDSMEDALVKTGARPPYSPEDLAIMESTTTVVDKEKMGL